jgi:hypothetical protein
LLFVDSIIKCALWIRSNPLLNRTIKIAIGGTTIGRIVGTTGFFRLSEAAGIYFKACATQHTPIAMAGIVFVLAGAKE